MTISDSPGPAGPSETPGSRPSAVETALRAAVRDVPDFPKPGIVFKDVTPALADAALFRLTTDALAHEWRGAGITHVVGIESRGFIFGAPVAQALGAGFLPIRKPGKLPFRRERIEYALEYGSDALEIHADACDAEARVLVVDDVLATGGTAAAAGALVELLGARLVGYAFVLELAFLGGRARLGSGHASAIVRY